MKFISIKTEIDYRNAVKHLENLGDSPDFQNNTEIQNEFNALEKLIELYDKEHYFIEKGNPIEIIKLKMNYMGLKQKDLIPAIGSKGLVSDVLNKKRKLSKKMIRELSKLIDVNQEILNTEYELSVEKLKNGNYREILPVSCDYEVSQWLKKSNINYNALINNFLRSVYQSVNQVQQGELMLTK